MSAFTQCVVPFVVAGCAAVLGSTATASETIQWLDMGPTPFGSSVPNNSVFSVPLVGDVTVTYSIPPQFVQTRRQDAFLQNGSVVYDGTDYCWVEYEHLALLLTGAMDLPWTVTYTFQNARPAGSVYLGVVGLGQTTDNGGRKSTATVQQSGTFLGDFSVPGFGPTLFLGGGGSFTMENSLTGAGGVNPHWNTPLGLVRIDDEITSLTVDLSQTFGDGVGLNIGFDTTVCATPPAGMTAWWTLDELSGELAADIQGGHDGAHGAAFGLPEIAPAMVNHGLLFRTGQHVLVPDHAQLDFGPGQDFSIDAWIRQDDDLNPELSPIVSKLESAAGWGQGYRFYLTEGPPELPALYLSSGGTSAIYVCPVGIGPADVDWHHVAVTVDRDDPQGVAFYFDGQLAGTFDGTALNLNLGNTQPLFLGDGPFADGYFRGHYLDEIEIFDRVLTPAEVLGMYIAGDLGKCRPCGPIEDDSLEHNDTPAMAAPLQPLSYVNLFVSQFDFDWYQIEVPARSILYVSTFFTHVDGDIDLELFDASGTTRLRVSGSSTDDEHVAWANTAWSPRFVLVKVRMKASSPEDCNLYALTWFTPPLNHPWRWFDFSDSVKGL